MERYLKMAASFYKTAVVWYTTAILVILLSPFIVYAKVKDAIEEARESAEMDRELEAALIDPEFLNRATLGITAEESDNIKRLAKELA